MANARMDIFISDVVQIAWTFTSKHSSIYGGRQVRFVPPMLGFRMMALVVRLERTTFNHWTTDAVDYLHISLEEIFIISAIPTMMQLQPF